MITLGRFRIEQKLLDLFQEYCKEHELIPSELIRDHIYETLRSNGIDIDSDILIGKQPRGRGKNTVSHGNKKVISQSIRFKILTRDNYRCVKCGRSPANEPGVKLHVDHILPESEGGIIEENNLQTLCEKCNLGKGNNMAMATKLSPTENELYGHGHKIISNEVDNNMASGHKNTDNNMAMATNKKYPIFNPRTGEIERYV